MQSQAHNETWEPVMQSQAHNETSCARARPLPSLPCVPLAPQMARFKVLVRNVPEDMDAQALYYQFVEFGEILQVRAGVCVGGDEGEGVITRPN